MQKYGILRRNTIFCLLKNIFAAGGAKFRQPT